jgi:hypothetical protein
MPAMQPSEAPESQESDDLIIMLRDMQRAYETAGADGEMGALAAKEAADRITALEAEVARLREALGEIATDEHPLGWIAIAALAQREQPVPICDYCDETDPAEQAKCHAKQCGQLAQGEQP